jgi:hypothetical protein
MSLQRDESRTPQNHLAEFVEQVHNDVHGEWSSTQGPTRVSHGVVEAEARLGRGEPVRAAGCRAAGASVLVRGAVLDARDPAGDGAAAAAPAEVTAAAAHGGAASVTIFRFIE